MSAARPAAASAVARKRLNAFERYLSLWVALCMAVGVAIGKLLPGSTDGVRRLEFGEGSQINVAIAVLICLFVFLRYGNLWVRSVLTNAGVGPFEMVAMSLRRVSPATIVNARVNVVQSRIPDIDKRDLEAHYLAGGNVERVVRALIAADRAGIGLDFRTAASIDLAGRDVLDAVRTSVTPKVIDCPNPASGKSEVAVQIAETFGGEVVNADAYQVYRSLDIGTAKPSAALRARVPHHLIDVRTPDEPLTLAGYLDTANAVLDDIWARGRLPVS